MSTSVKSSLLAALGVLATVPLSAGALLENITPRSAAAPERMQLRSAMRQVELPRLNAPALNGGSAGWENALADDAFTVIYDRAVEKAKGRQATGDWQNFMSITLPPSQKTAILLGYDDRYLYLSADCREKIMERIVMEPSPQRDAPVYGGDCLDVMIAPNRNAPDLYQLVVNALGRRYDARVTMRDGKQVSDPSWNPEYPLWAATEGDRWRLVMAVPLKECGITPREGTFADINICRNEIPFKEASSWGAVKRSFHERDKMVRVWFGKAAPPDVALDRFDYSAPGIGDNTLKVSVVNPGSHSFQGSLQLVVTSPDKTMRQSSYPVEIPSGGTITIPTVWAAPQPGEYTVAANLHKGETTLDSGKVHATIADVLKFTLSSREFFSGTGHIDGAFQTALANPEEYGLRVSLGTQSFTIDQLRSNNCSFRLNVEKAPDRGTCRAELFERKTGKSLTTQSVELTRNADPFQE